MEQANLQSLTNLTINEPPQNTPILELPIDVISLILSLIPNPKTLSRFKCVSKTWLSLISSPQFTKSHFLTNSKSNRRLILSFTKGDYFDHYPFSLFLSTATITPRDITEVTNDCFFDIPAKIIGSVNGLICVYFNKNELIVWNPSIRKRKTVPDYNVDVRNTKCKFGFGFDDVSNDYKIVGFFNKVSDEYAVIVKVFSFKTGEWKRIGSSKGTKFYGQDEPVIAFGNGKFYWMSFYSPRVEKGWTVWTLELERWVYCSFDVPVTDYRMNYTLSLDEGGLVHVLGIADGFAEVWTMKEGKESEVIWSKVCVIDFAKVGLRVNPLFILHCHLFHVLDNGEVMMRHLNTFIVYNPKEGSMRYCQVESPLPRIKACTYVESLEWL